MAEKYDYFGAAYDDAHPAFIELPSPPHPKNADGDAKFVLHRTSGRIIDLAALRERATADGYTLESPEIGSDVEWLQENTHYVPNADPDNPVLPDTLTITSPTDGSTVTDPLYSVMGAGAEPDAEVELWSSDRDPAADEPNATTTADGLGTFTFAGTHPAVDGETTWTVTSGEATSDAVTVTVDTSGGAEEPETEPTPEETPTDQPPQG